MRSLGLAKVLSCPHPLSGRGEWQPPGLPFLGQQPLLTLSAWHPHWFLRSAPWHLAVVLLSPRPGLPGHVSKSQGPAREHSKNSFST